MGNVVVTEFVTIDGVMEDPGGGEPFARGGWAFKFGRGDEGDRFKLDELMAADVLLLGRRTYEGFARAWPSMAEGEFGVKMNSMKKAVVTSTPLGEPGWTNSAAISADLAAEITKLKAENDGDILVAGSAQLVQGLLAADLVDELRLMVFPTVLGEGKKLFADGGTDAASFELVEVRQSASVALLVLRRER
jgi:dihydrofolate reductase